MSVMRRPAWLLLLLVLAGCVTSGGERPQRLLSGAQPEYPATARRDRIEGFVTLRYRIRADGSVDDVEVIEAQPAGVFDSVALAAVRSWRYEPARRGGRPVDVPSVVSTLRFKLDDSAYADY